MFYFIDDDNSFRLVLLLRQGIWGDSDSIDVEDIKHELKNAETIKGFNIAKEKHRASVEYLLRNNLRAYRQISDIAETRELQLNNGQ